MTGSTVSKRASPSSPRPGARDCWLPWSSTATFPGRCWPNANEAGILLNGVRPNAVRFMPPLNITPEEIDEGVARLEDALAKI